MSFAYFSIKATAFFDIMKARKVPQKKIIATAMSNIVKKICIGQSPFKNFFVSKNILQLSQKLDKFIFSVREEVGVS